MYIKKVTKTNGVTKKVYSYLHLVENIRTEKGPRQKLILNLGNLPNIHPSQYKSLSNRIENILTGQKCLFEIDPTIDKTAQTAVKKIFKKQAQEKPSGLSHYETVDVNSIRSENIRSIGSEYICTQIWNELKIDEFLIDRGVSSKVLPIMKALVIGRIIEPGSERSTKNWSETRSALYEITGSPLRNSLNSYYRAGDTLYDLKEELEEYLKKTEQKLFSLKEKIILYDLTNTYFEGQMKKNNKARFGRSKEKRSDCKLLTLGLILDEQGFVKSSKLFPGNQSECQTLSEMILSLENKISQTKIKRTVVLDAGIATKENITWLKSNKYNYVVVNRGKPPVEMKNNNDLTPIYNAKNSNVRVKVKRYPDNNEMYILCHSTSRAEKEKSIRSRIEKLFIEKLAECQKGLATPRKTKNYRKICEKIGRLKEKYPKISKLYEIIIEPEKNTKKQIANLNAINITFKKNHKYCDTTQKEGHYILRTDRIDLTDEEIWKLHNMLTKVEASFRYLKSDLGIRPNFHQKETRADAHIFISVLAYHILHIIEYRLAQKGYNKNWRSIKKIMQTHSRLSIFYKSQNVTNSSKEITNQLRICSQVEPEQKKIYKLLNLKEEPLPKKIFKMD